MPAVQPLLKNPRSNNLTPALCYNRRMKILKVIGAMLIFSAGYLAHIMITGNWPIEAKVYVSVGILFIIHIGAAAMLARSGKSFIKNFIEALAWPLRGL
jgi:hypothetical protein